MTEREESERDELIAVVRAMAARLPVDWAEVESSAGDDSLRATVRELKIIAEITELHRSLPAIDFPSSPVSTDSPSTESSSVPSRSLVEPASSIGSWGPLTLLEQVGHGSFGEVYRALDSRLDREVALKLLRRRDASTDPLGSAVIEEGRLLARVRHPNVVTVHGADRIDGRVGVWMEFVHGRTLEQALQRQGPFPPAEVAAVGVEICRALGAVHQAGLLHRDIKAHNVMQQDDGRLVVMDFGAGRELADDCVASDLAGTPLYLAPEILEGQPATVRSDIYSVGVLLYHLLTNAYPVAGRTVSEIRHCHRTRQRVTLTDDRTGFVSGRLIRVINRVIDVDSEARYGSADELATELAACCDTPVRGGWRGRRFLPALAAGLVLIGAAIAAVLPKIEPPEEARTPVKLQATATAGPENPGDPSTPSSAAARPSPPSVVSAPALRFEARNWVLISAFENRTGESVLDGTLEFALEHEFANSAFVNVVPRERINDVLRLMQKPADTRVDTRLGREIAVRDGGIRALVAGRVERIGGTYVISSQILNPEDGLVATSLIEEAHTQAELLPAVRRQAFRVREALGEMLSTIQQSQTALEKVTTPSLHALQLYSQADSLIRSGKDAAAEELLKDTIDEDKDFASAYILIAHAIHNQGRPSAEYVPYAERAVQLAKRASGVERYFILGSYYGLLADAAGSSTHAVAHRRRSADAYEALLRLKPDHFWGVGNLYFTYESLKLEPEATEMTARMADVRSQSVLFHIKAAERLLWKGDSQRARTYIARAKALDWAQALDKGTAGRQADDRLAHIFAFEAYEPWLRGDVSGVLRVADDLRRRFEGAKGGHASTHPLPTTLPNMYVGLGRFRDARTVALSLAPNDTRSRWMYSAVRGQAFLGDRDAVGPLRDMLVAFQEPRAFPVNAVTVSDLIRLGMLDKAREVADLAKEGLSRSPAFHLPEIEGHLALAEGHIDEGVRVFESLANRPGMAPNDLLRMASTLSDAWTVRGDIQRATKILEDTTLDRELWKACVTDYYYGVASWIHARDELAELYVATGRGKEAEAIDAELLKLLAVADTDHPVLARIKARQAKLEAPDTKEELVTVPRF
jgi:serine/threonine-protein kinase